MRRCWSNRRRKDRKNRQETAKNVIRAVLKISTSHLQRYKSSVSVCKCSQFVDRKKLHVPIDAKQTDQIEQENLSLDIQKQYLKYRLYL